MNAAILPVLVEAAARSFGAAIVVWTLLRLLRARNVPAQKVAWTVVLFAAFAMPFAMRLNWLPASVALRVPAFRWNRAMRLMAETAPAVPAAQTTAARTRATTTHGPEPLFVITQTHNGATDPVGTVREPASPAGTGLDFEAAAQPAAAGRVTASAPRPPAVRPRSLRPLTIAWLVYLAITGTLLLRLVLGLVSSMRLWLSSRPVSILFDPGEMSRARFRFTPRVASPVNVGSSIVLPADYTEWDWTKLRVVLAHERAHVRQGDFYFQLLASLYAALFWFSPLGWWLKHRLSELGEAMSDRAGLREAASRASYAELLLEFASLPHPASTGVAMARTGNLAPRIERLLDESIFHQAFATGRRRALLIVLVVPVALFASTALVRVQAAAQAPPQAVPGQQTAPDQTIAQQTQPPAQPPAQAQPDTGVSTPPDGPITDQMSPAPPASAPEPGAAPVPAAPGPASIALPAAPQSLGAVPAPPAVVAVPPAYVGPGAVPMPPMPPVQGQVPPIPPMSDFNAELNANLDAMRNRIYFSIPYIDVNNGQPWAIVNGSSGSQAQSSFYGHFDGGSREAFERARETAHGPFLWFERDGKSYIVEDPTIVNEIAAMEKPMDDLRSQMRALGDQQRESGRQLRELMRQQHLAAISKPDLSRQMAALNAAVDSLKASQGTTVTQRQLMEVQSRLAALQGQLARAESGLYANAWSSAMEKYSEQEGKLGAQEGKLGASMARMAAANSSKIDAIIDQSLRDGKAAPLQNPVQKERRR